MPACGPPSSLSPLKVTRSTPRRSDVARPRAPRRTARRSARAPLPRSSITRAPRSWAKRDELVERRLRGEADDAVVARVHAQHGARALASRRLEVAQVGAVRGARPRPGGRRSRRGCRGCESRRRSRRARRARRSPRRRGAVAASASSTAAALLLTTSASSAPVSAQSASCTWRWRVARSPRRQVELEVGVRAGRRGDGGDAPRRGSSERPRLVWTTTPVALITRRSDGVTAASTSRATQGTRCGGREGGGVALTPALEDLARAGARSPCARPRTTTSRG